MQVSAATAKSPVSPYVQQFNSFKIANNNFLIQSVINSINGNSTLGFNQPAYPWGSPAAQMYQLSQTINTLKTAWQTGHYGKANPYAVGGTVNQLA